MYDHTVWCTKLKHLDTVGVAHVNMQLKQLLVSLPILLTLYHVAHCLGYFPFRYVSTLTALFTFHHILSRQTLAFEESV